MTFSLFALMFFLVIFFILFGDLDFIWRKDRFIFIWKIVFTEKCFLTLMKIEYYGYDHYSQ